MAIRSTARNHGGSLAACNDRLRCRRRAGFMPIVVQHTRLDSRQAENALMTTIAFPS
jgi:hypothetical protein